MDRHHIINRHLGRGYGVMAAISRLAKMVDAIRSLRPGFIFKTSLFRPAIAAALRPPCGSPETSGAAECAPVAGEVPECAE